MEYIVTFIVGLLGGFSLLWKYIKKRDLSKEPEKKIDEMQGTIEETNKDVNNFLNDRLLCDFLGFCTFLNGF